MGGSCPCPPLAPRASLVGWGDMDLASLLVSFSRICLPCAEWSQVGEMTLGEAASPRHLQELLPKRTERGPLGLAGGNQPLGAQGRTTVV